MAIRVLISLLFYCISVLSFAQPSLLDKKIKLDILNGTIENILHEIGEKGDFTVSCSNYLINFNREVNLRKKKETVRYFLDYIFEDTGMDMDYYVRDNKVILKPRKIVTKFITISGKITDDETGLPIINSNVNIAGTYIGATSDNYGRYTLKLKINEKGEKLILNYSHVSYDGETVFLSTNQDFDVDVKMKTKIQELNEVEIFGVPHITFEKKNYNIHDYELSDDNILLTVYERRISKSEMLVVKNNKQFLNSRKIPGTPIGTFKDCSDDLHLITYYHPYKITIDSTIKLETTAQNEVNRINKPCAAIGPNGFYYYYFYGPALLSVDYLYYDPILDREVVFRRITDSLQLLKYKDAPELFKESIGNGRGAQADLDMGGLKEHKAFLKEGDTLYQPLYAPLFYISSSLYLFNHTESKIELYNFRTDHIRDIPISYHKKAGWSKKLYLDKIKGKVYTDFREDGSTVVYEINIADGSIKNPFKITYKDIEKIQVNDGNIYFLYSSNDNRSDRTKCLFQQRLY